MNPKNCNFKQGFGDSSVEVAKWIESQTRPVVILHHESPSSYHYINRALASNTTTGNGTTVTTTVTPLTEFQISQYQV